MLLSLLPPASRKSLWRRMISSDSDMAIGNIFDPGAAWSRFSFSVVEETGGKGFWNAGDSVNSLCVRWPFEYSNIQV